MEHLGMLHASVWVILTVSLLGQRQTRYSSCQRRHMLSPPTWLICGVCDYEECLLNFLLLHLKWFCYSVYYIGYNIWFSRIKSYSSACFEQNLEVDELNLAEIGPKFEYHVMFPARTNTGQFWFEIISVGHYNFYLFYTLISSVYCRICTSILSYAS